MPNKPQEPILSVERRFAEYSVPEYIDYIDSVRRALFDKKNLARADEEFLNKQFVEEMEPLAKVCQHYFNGDHSGVRVQYMDAQLTDGRISYPDGLQDIFIEFTCSRQTWRLKHAYEQLTEMGNLISLTGSSSDVLGLIQGDSTNAIVGGTVDELCNRQRIAIEEVIDKKLKKRWADRNNWLCVVVDDVTFWDEDAMKLALADIHALYERFLSARNISALWFIGFESTPVYFPIRKLCEICPEP